MDAPSTSHVATFEATSSPRSSLSFGQPVASSPSARRCCVGGNRLESVVDLVVSGCDSDGADEALGLVLGASSPKTHSGKCQGEIMPGADARDSSVRLMRLRRPGRHSMRAWRRPARRSRFPRWCIRRAPRRRGATAETPSGFRSTAVQGGTSGSRRRTCGSWIRGGAVEW